MARTADGTLYSRFRYPAQRHEPAGDRPNPAR